MRGKDSELAIIGYAGVFLFFLFLIPYATNVDLFVELRLGLDRLQGDHDVNDLTLLGSGALEHHRGWLFQVISAIAFSLGGFVCLRLLNAVLLAGAFSIALFHGLRRLPFPTARAEIARIAAVSLFIGVLPALSNTRFRPQVLSFVLLALLHWLLESKMSLLRKLCLSAVIGLVWQNSHPTVVVGALLAASVSVRDLFFRSSPRPIIANMAVCGCLLITQLLTPDGAHIFSVVRQNVVIAREVLGISEWLPPWHQSVRGASVGFVVSLVAIATLLARRDARSSYRDLVATLPFLVASLFAARFMTLWGLVTLPYLPRLLAIPQVKHLKVPGGVWLARSAIVVVAVCAATTPTLPWYVPVGCLETLSRQQPSGVVFADEDLAGPALLFGSRQWKVVLDGRVYRYSPEEVRRYKSVKTARDLDLFFGPRSIAAVVLSSVEWHELAADLRHDTAWRAIVDERDCVAFVRTSES